MARLAGRSKMKKNSANLVRAFLYGMTGAGLFHRLDYPGAPKEFVDSRPLNEVHACGEFERTCNAYTGAKFAKQRDDARRSRTATETEAEEVKAHAR
jgi:hypothetical protein